MSNNLDSNITQKVAKVFNKAFETARTVSKTVNTELLQGKHDASTGETVYTKRPHQYRNVPTSDGDISAATKNSIISGKCPATVQDYITVPMEWNAGDEALKLDQLEKIIQPAAETCVITMEMMFQQFAVENLGLSYGVPGVAVDAFTDVSMCNALLDSIGVPKTTDRYYIINPFSDALLASAQAGLSNEMLTKAAWERAHAAKRIGGFVAIPAGGMYAYTTGTLTPDRVGAIDAAPAATYLAAKDTMNQTVALKGLTASLTIEEGEILEYSTIYMRNPRTGQIIYGSDGNPVKFRQTVVTGGTTDGTGDVTLTVTPAGIYEANGQYNNISAAIAINDVVTVLGAASTTYQPNLFYHKDALGIATIKLPKLYSTDTIITTEDNISIRVSKYSDGDANSQKIRFDLRPVFSCFNPLFGGKSYGVA